MHDEGGGQRIALGVYVRGYPSDPSALDRYVETAGTAPAIVNVFRNWTDDTGTFDPGLADAIRATGALPMISWQPPADSLAAIARGEHDRYARAYASATRDWGGALLLRFAHEMNGSWIPWAADGPTYRAAWRRLHGMFQNEAADNVAWVWSPHVRDARADRFEPYYPGPDAVDWAALDGYNWGRSQPSSRWQSFDSIFAASYEAMLALAPEKPMLIAEVGCAEEGGDKATWVIDAFADAIPRRFPALRAVVWFHAYPPGHADWRIDSSPPALAAWRSVVASPRYAATALSLTASPRR